MNGLTKWRSRNLPERRNDPFTRLQHEINRVFDRDLWDWFDRDSLLDEGLAPALDIRETDENVEVLCELPGVDRKDIDISVSGNVLTIKGEKKGEHEDRKSDYYRRESWSGSFQRSVSLPDSVNADAATAEMKDGVLKLVLPKREKKKRTQIDIKVK